MFDLDEETKEELIKAMKKKAECYVPEWRFDAENPDIGTALALVYADMAGKTMRRMQKIMSKHGISFLNMLDASLKPAQPSKGYVTFSLVNEEVPGTYVKAGTAVMADSDEAEDGIISFETLNDVFVTPARLSVIYEVDDTRDYIGKCFDEETKNQESYLFETVNPNLQEHELFLGHRDLFCIKGKSEITLCMEQSSGLMMEQKQLEILADRKNVQIAYSCEAGFEPFEKVKAEDGKLLLSKGKDQPPFSIMEVNGVCAYWIRLTVRKVESVSSVQYKTLRLGAASENIQPDFVLADGEEADLKKYFPFGERICIYNEVYFTSEEVLSKKGAEVELSFFLSFASVPLDFNVENEPVKWEWIMDESVFSKEKEYDISIACVLWEYYNGTGWTRLFADEKGSDMFCTRNGENYTYRKLSFLCPDDLEPVLVHAKEVHSIRARITKVNHAYKLNGNYIVPVAERTLFQYSYPDKMPLPHVTFARNNLEWVQKEFLHTEEFRPFIQMDLEVPMLYLGFSMPLFEGPVKILFQLKDTVNRSDASLTWQYYNGQQWKTMHVVDETRNFSQTGIVSFSGYADLKKKTIFEKCNYWIRIVDIRNYYRNNDSAEPVPHVVGVFMNSVKVVNQGESNTEYFRMEYYEKNVSFQLLKTGIVKVKVYIREEVPGTAQPEWKQWEKVPDFRHSGEYDSHFRLVPDMGCIQFGDGRNGKVPPVSREENIKVVYQCGGGEYTNVPANGITKMSQTIGFINRVYNPEKMMGGTDLESREHAIKRCQGEIRHQNRAITATDFELLAYAASRDIRKAKCFSGYNKNGERQPGAVTLVILIKGFDQGLSPFQSVCGELEHYLKERMNKNILENGKLHLVEPCFVELKVKTDIMVSDFDFVFTVKKEMEAVLKEFLDPVKGNFNHKGWEIGQLPNQIQLRNAMQRVKNITRIGNVFLTAYVQGILGLKEIELEQVKQYPFVLPVSGEHEIHILFE